MRIRTLIQLCLALVMFGALCAASTAPSLADAHKSKGVTCAACHGEGAKKPVAKEQCQSCHGSYADLKQKTANLEPNPHYNHTIDADCSRCHHAHKASENYCQSCHAGLQFVAEKKEKK